MSARGWTATLVGALSLVVVAGIAIRVALAPQPGLAGDLDEFIGWVHGIAVGGLADAYHNQLLSFPPVITWIWGTLAALQPAFTMISNASDPAINALMKVPACLADLGVAASVVWWFRDRPRLAVAAAAAMLLWPATWYLSAWWGQYEPVYVLPVLLALLAARARRPGLAAALLAVGLVTKPQAWPLAVPFAAWFLATGGWRGAVRAAATAAAVVVVAWLPFLAAGGPMDYLRNIGKYEDAIFPLLSVRAWNPWWMLQEFGAGGGFVSDQTAVLGPVTFRLIGMAAAVLVGLTVFVGVYRRPVPENLAMGLAAVALGAFVTLTTMHERYAYPALVFLVLCWPRRQVVAAWLVFATAFTLNLVYAVPPSGVALPAESAVSVVGSVVILAVAIAAIRWTWRGVDPLATEGAEALPEEQAATAGAASCSDALAEAAS